MDTIVATTLEAAERNQKGYDYANEQGWIYHNKYGQALRCLDPVDLDILIKAGYIEQDNNGKYRCTEKRYHGVIFSDFLDTMRIHDAVIANGFYIETPD